MRSRIAPSCRSRAWFAKQRAEPQDRAQRAAARTRRLRLLCGHGIRGHEPNPGSANSIRLPQLRRALENALNYSSPEYQAGFQLNIPLRNRIAKADQYRTELEYRQSQVYLEELKKHIRIEVRNASYALEQGASRVDAARKARDLAQRTLDIMQKEQKLGAGSNQQTLAAEHDLSLAESALVTAETAYEKARIEVRRATGSVSRRVRHLDRTTQKPALVEANHSR